MTRPDYADIIPLYNISGGSGTVTYRNPFLEPGVSQNRDYVTTFYDNRLGLLSFSYFTKEIKDLIYSSGRRYITDPSLYELPHYTEKYMINDLSSDIQEIIKFLQIAETQIKMFANKIARQPTFQLPQNAPQASQL